MRWSLKREYKSLSGVVDFHDTGKTFEAASDQVHAKLVEMQERDGCCYSAEPAGGGILSAAKRGLRRISPV